MAKRLKPERRASSTTETLPRRSESKAAMPSRVANAAVAAAHATLDVLESDAIPQRFAALGRLMEDGAHALRGEPNVIDIRNFAAAAAVELAPLPGKPGLRAIRLFEEALKRDLLVRFTGDTIALAPPAISTEAEIHRLFDTLRDCIRAVA